MEQPNDLISIGVFAAQQGRSVGECLDQLAAIGVTPAMRLNGVAYFRESEAMAAAEKFIIRQESGRQQFIESIKAGR